LKFESEAAHQTQSFRARAKWRIPE
jgi:hypothetical protein